MAIAYYADLGIAGYTDALRIQRELVDMRHTNQIRDMVLFAQHNPAILFGHDKEKNSFSNAFLEKLQDEDARQHLKNLGIEFHDGTKQIESAVYTGPGHLFVHPIIDYTKWLQSYDVPGYNNLVDGVILNTMDKFGITDSIMIGDKIAVRADKFVILGEKRVHMTHKIASHGFQLHVNRNGMGNFWLINPYGHKNNLPVSMEEMSERNIDMRDVKKAVLASMKSQLGYKRFEECKIELKDDKVSVRKL